MLASHFALLMGAALPPPGVPMPSNIINVLDVPGVKNDDTDWAATRAGWNQAILQLNAQSSPQDWALWAPPGRYGLDQPLTPADGDYSIIMSPGAAFWDHYAPKNATMLRLGHPNVQADGHGVVGFVLAMEGRGPNSYSSQGNIAFELVNIDHYFAAIQQAYKFVTGLKLVADGTGENHHHYDATIQLGYLHAGRQPVVLETRNGNGAWMNNIRFYGGNFQAAAGTVPGSELPLRYISALAFEGECKATFHGPLCDGHSFTALYSHNASVAVYDGHMENPTWLIEHAPGAVTFGGAEPCTWIAPRLEDKQFKIFDPEDVGSYGHDPFWNGLRTQPKALTASRNLSLGDIRAARTLYTEAASATLNITQLTGNSQPTPMARVYLHRRGAGALEVDRDSGVTVRTAPGKQPALREGGKATLEMIDPNAQTWWLDGDLLP